MADRQLKITVRTEIQKGFGELASQLSGLTKQLESLSTLSTGINKLATAFEHVGSNARIAQKAANTVNKEIDAGVKIVAQYTSAQDKAKLAAEKLNTAVKAGAVNKSAALKSEIALLETAIKKTNDLSLLERSRNSRGQFGYGGFSPQATKAVATKVLADLEKQQYDKRIAAATKGNDDFVKALKNGHAKEDATLSSLFAKQDAIQTKNLEEQTRIDKLKEAEIERTYSRQIELANLGSLKLARLLNKQGGHLSIDQLDSQLASSKDNAYVKALNRAGGFDRSPTGGSGGGYRFRGGGFGGSGGGSGFSFGTGPSAHGGSEETSLEKIHKLSRAYTELGHVMFQLQYSTYTFFAVSGLEFITHQLDKYTELRNEIARTTQSTQTLGENMKNVFDISRATFTAPEESGKLYSRINTYSKALGYNSTDVKNVSQNLQSAIAVSAVNPAMKLRANTEIAEILSGNSAQGPQLRALQREAPMVMQMVAQNIARQRGMAPGSTIDVREKGLKIGAKDILSAYNPTTNPDAAKPAMMIKDRDRTFADVKAVLGNDFQEYVGTLKTTFGGLQIALNNVIDFLNDKARFASFMNALGSAAVGLAVFGASLMAESGKRLLGNGIEAIGNLYGKTRLGINAARNLDPVFAEMNAASRMAQARTFGPHLPGHGIAEAEALAASKAETLGLARQNLTPGMKIARGLGELTEGLGRFDNGIAQAIPKMLKSAAAVTILGLSFDILLGLLVIIPLALAALAARFNYLLNKFGDGINIFDIIGGTWDKLTRIFHNMDEAIGGPFDKIIKFIDKILMRKIEDSKADPDDRRHELKRMYGMDTNGQIRHGLITGVLSDGRTGQLRVDNNGNIIKDGANRPSVYLPGSKKTAALLTLDEQNQNKTYKGYSAGLADPKTEQKGKSEQEKRWDKYENFLQSSALDIWSKNDQRGVPEGYKDTQKAYDDAVKKIADIYDVKAFKGNRQTGYTLKSNDELLESLKIALDKDKGHKTKKGEAISPSFEDVMRMIMGLKGSAYSDAVTKFDKETEKDLSKKAMSSKLLINSLGISNVQKQYRENDLATIEHGLKDPGMGAKWKTTDHGGVSLAEEVDNALSKGKITEALDMLKKYASDGGAELDYFGAKLKLITDEQEAQKKNWKGGMSQAMVDYKAHITDAASNMHEVFGHAFQGMEDMLISWISTGKMGFKQFAASIIADLTRVFVEFRLMAPLMEFMKGSSAAGGTGIWGSVLKYGTQAINYLTGGASAVGSVSAGLTNMAVSTTSSSLISSLAGVFHSGGVAGTPSGTSRYVSNAMFSGATRYHTGGIAGLRPDEVPAILQRGERIIPKNASHNTGSVFAPQVSLVYHASPAGGGNSGMSQEEHSKQMADMVQQSIRTEIMAHERSKQMPGSAAWRANKY